MHLVDVHVALGAGAGLPDDQWKVVVVQFARDDIIGSLRNSLANLRIESELLVHLGGGLLQDAHGLHNGFLHHEKININNVEL